MNLAFADRRPENVRVRPVIIAELELGDIERRVLFADLVEGSDHAALDQRPEAFKRVRVNDADTRLPAGMMSVQCEGGARPNLPESISADEGAGTLAAPTRARAIHAAGASCADLESPRCPPPPRFARSPSASQGRMITSRPAR